MADQLPIQTTRVEINPCPPETDDEELEMKRELLKATLKHMGNNTCLLWL